MGLLLWATLPYLFLDCTKRTEAQGVQPVVPLTAPLYADVESSQLPCDASLDGDPKHWSSDYDQFVRVWAVPGMDSLDGQMLSHFVTTAEFRQCDNLIFTSLPESWIPDHFIPGDGLEDMIIHNSGWVGGQPGVCYVNLYFTCQPFPKYPQPAAVDTDWSVFGLPLKFQSRYWTMIELTKFFLSQRNSIPFLLYADADVLFTSKRRTLQSLIDRADRALRRGSTSESRRYGLNGDSFSVAFWPEQRQPGTHMPRRTSQAQPYVPPLEGLTIDDLALMVAVDPGCTSRVYLINSGVMLVRPSRTAQFVLDATIARLNYTGMALPGYFMDTGDQGRLAWVLKETFKMDLHRVREMCDELEPLSESCLEDEMIMVRQIDLEAVFSHPLYSLVGSNVFGSRAEAEALVASKREPTYVALVCARWMNSGAANRHYSMWSKRRSSEWAYQCGDFAAHFAGTDKHWWQTAAFRKLAVANADCASDWPATDPFNATQWVQEALPGELSQSDYKDFWPSG